MHSADLILIFGHDPLLLKTRQHILEQEGFAVRVAGDVDEAMACVESNAIVLVILCQTLAEHEMEAVLKLGDRVRPQMKSLMLARSGHGKKTRPRFNYLDFDHQPRRLIEAARHLSRTS